MSHARPGAGRGLMVLLGALSAFGPLSMDLYLPALPALAADLDADQSAVQLTLVSVALGLAVGQLAAGPLSDRFGRRGPLLLGVGAWALAGLMCALAPSIEVLVAVRLLQGLGGAAGIVLARAVVRDLMSGADAGRAYALLASIGGVAPVLAPVAGAQLLRVADWRGVFGTLAVLGVVLLVASAWRLPETLPRERRVRGGLRATVGTAGRLLSRRAFLTPVLAQGLSFGALFTYISTSSFVLQDGYRLTDVQFSLAFAVNAVGIVLAGTVSRATVRRFGSRSLLLCGLSLQVVGGVLLLVTALAGWGIPVVLPGLFVVVAASGLVLPNATALAMSDAARSAGTASALVGAGQFAMASAWAPLVGFGPAGSLLPMAAVMTGAALLACAAGWLVPHRQPGPPAPPEVPAGSGTPVDRATA